MATAHIKVECPLCHEHDAITVRFWHEPQGDEGGGLQVEYVRQTCSCAYDDLMSGPFDAVVETVQEWAHDCYPYAIHGQWEA